MKQIDEKPARPVRKHAGWALRNKAGVSAANPGIEPERPDGALKSLILMPLSVMC